MDNLSAAWLYPIIIIAGVLQAWGPPMNNALKKALVNPWLGSLVSFLPIVAFLSVVLMCLPRPLPPRRGLEPNAVVGAPRRPGRRIRHGGPVCSSWVK